MATTNIPAPIKSDSDRVHDLEAANGAPGWLRGELGNKFGTDDLAPA